MLETQKVKTTVNTFRKIQNLQWSAVFSTTFFCTLHYFSLASALLLQPSSSLIPHPSSLSPCCFSSLTLISHSHLLLLFPYSSSFFPHPPTLHPSPFMTYQSFLPIHPLPFIPPHSSLNIHPSPVIPPHSSLLLIPSHSSLMHYSLYTSYPITSSLMPSL